VDPLEKTLELVSHQIFVIEEMRFPFDLRLDYLFVSWVTSEIEVVTEEQFVVVDYQTPFD
jgi:hypothetical protein